MQLAKSWESTPGTENDKELAVSKPGEWIYVGTRTIEGEAQRNELGTFCKKISEQKVFIKYDVNKCQFDEESSAPRFKGYAFDIIFLMGALLGVIAFCSLGIALIQTIRNEEKIENGHLITMLVFGAMTFLNSYLFYLTLGLASFFLFATIFKFWKRRKKSDA